MQRKFIAGSLTIRSKRDSYTNEVKSYNTFCTLGGNVYIPLGVWRHFGTTFPNTREYTPVDISFKGTLLTVETDPMKRNRDQNIAMSLALERLVANHTCFLSCHTGYGKTACSVYLTSKIKLKTVFMVHSTVVKKQTVTAFKKFSKGARVQLVTGEMKPEKYDIFVMGIQKAGNIPMDKFKDIGLVIVDEAHRCTISAFTKILHRMQPKYLVGMSATPDRSDSMETLFYPYFGDPEDYIIRREKKPFKVVKYKTSYKPEIDYIYRCGKKTLDWNLVVNSLAENKERCKEIADIIDNHPGERGMISCDRIAAADEIYNILLAKGINVGRMYSKYNDWGPDKRILVAGAKKAGEGFDDPTLTFLIVVVCTKDVRQIEGRIRTTNNVIYDIVDDFGTLERHWALRKKWYIERGADIVYNTGDEEEPDTPRERSTKLRYI